MATANGLRSTPCTASSARRTTSPSVPVGLAFLPPLDQPVEGAEQEVAGAAGRVDHLDGLAAELVDRRVERPVEDELLDELRGLQQRVGLPRASDRSW